MKWLMDDEVSVIPEGMVRGGFAMILNDVKHVFVYSIDGSRIWNGSDKNREDQLTVDRSEWVDYQLESMFKGW